MSADFWLGLQQDWDLWHAMHSKDAVGDGESEDEAGGPRKRREILEWVGKVDYEDDYDPKRLRNRKPQ